MVRHCRLVSSIAGYPLSRRFIGNLSDEFTSRQRSSESPAVMCIIKSSNTLFPVFAPFLFRPLCFFPCLSSMLLLVKDPLAMSLSLTLPSVFLFFFFFLVTTPVSIGRFNFLLFLPPVSLFSGEVVLLWLFRITGSGGRFVVLSLFTLQLPTSFFLVALSFGGFSLLRLLMAIANASLGPEKAWLLLLITASCLLMSLFTLQLPT